MMKNEIILIALTICSTAFATSMSPPPSLENRVMKADHIFLATVQKVEVLDAQTNVVANPPSPLESGTRLRLTVKPEKSWIRTPLKKLPPDVQVTYDIGKFILSYDGEKKHYLNKEFVFLLVGQNFSPVAFFSFAVPKEQLPAITKILETKPIEKKDSSNQVQEDTARKLADPQH